MAGCYGSSSFDRHYERELDKYLEQFDDEEVCEYCNGDGEIHILYEDSRGRDMDKYVTCKNCN